jgi:hypothetical protein
MRAEPKTRVQPTTEIEPLRQIIADLIDVMHLQAKELEKMITHVEQVTGYHLGYQDRFSLVASELSELHSRVKKLASAQ